MRKIFFMLLVFLSASVRASTFNATPAMSEATIQTGVTSACGAAGGIVDFAAGNYTSWTTQMTIPSANGCVVSGPTSGTPAVLNSDGALINATIFALTGCGSGTTPGSNVAISHLTFIGTVSANGTSALNIPASCGGFSIDHIEWSGNDPTPGTTAQTAAAVYMGGGNSNFSMTNNYFHDSCTQIDAHGTYTDYGGYCAATFISGTGEDLNDVWSNNRVLTMEQGLKITQNSAAVGSLTVTGNSFINWHRIAIEIQSGGTNDTINNVFSANYFGPPFDPCYLTYALSIPMNNTGSPASTANDNVFITPNAVACGGANNHYGIAIEIWGNGVISQQNLIEGGQVANSGWGYSLGHGANANITNNTASGYYVTNSGLIGQDTSAGPVTTPTLSPNTVTMATPTITIPTPTISPASGSFASPPTVTLSDPRANTTIFYTTDGSTPTTSSTQYTGPFTAPALPVTINAIAQWGIGANAGISFPTGFGYTASSTATANYTGSSSPTSVTISPNGSIMQFGSTFTYTATCAPSACSSYGGVTWSTSWPAELSVTSGGVASWTVDPGAMGYNCGYVIATVGTTVGKAGSCVQHAGDTWITFVTPDPANYNQLETGTPQPLYLAVGSTAALGFGMIVEGSGTAEGAPIAPQSCTWQTSNAAVATVNTLGDVTAVAPGNVTITCGLNGNGVFGTYTGSPSWVAPGNVINLVVQNGGTSTNTWYVRPDGGTPYVDGTTTPFGQCSGKVNASYASITGIATDIWRPGVSYALGTYIVDGNGSYQKVTTAGVSGTASHPTFSSTPGGTTTEGTVTWTNEGPNAVNQACAMQNLRYLWSNENGYISTNWMISGGDTVYVAPNPAGYNVGGEAFNYPGNCHGNAFDCYMPTIPSGTSAGHTRILGTNYNSCQADSAKTLLDVTYEASSAFNVKDSQFVDIACFEVTDRSEYSPGGEFDVTPECPNTPAADCGGNYAIVQSALTSNVTYTDMFMHGTKTSIFGATGVGVTATRTKTQGEFATGIDMDDHPFTFGNMSTAGGLTMTYSSTWFSGCLEEYPIVHNYPYLECRDQNTGGQGDGFGTANTSGDWIFDHDLWFANFQDGLDLLHSGMHLLSVTNSQSIANDGQAYKLGSGDDVTFRNNLAAATCDRILYLFGDEPATAIVPGVSPCRANGTSVLMNFTNYGTYNVQNNTFLGDNNIHIEMECEGGWTVCSNAGTVSQNNVFIGFQTSTGNTTAIPYFLDDANMPTPNGFTVQNNNIYFNSKNCTFTMFANEFCNTTSPSFVGQPPMNITDVRALDNFNFNPSVLIGGTTLSGVTTDMTGSTYSSPPSMGAIQYFASPATTTVGLSALNTSVPSGQPVVMNATVTPSLSVGIMTFKDGATTLGTVIIEPHTSTAPFTISTLAAGTHSITAVLTSISDFAASTSAPLSVTIGTPAVTGVVKIGNAIIRGGVIIQ